MELPKRTTVLVIGGGPAGSCAAAFLAREGVQVVLVERDVFPRYHIGESLLPSCLEILELIGARDLIERQGFQRKPGAYLEWKGEKWSLDFGEISGRYKYSFQVPRAEFDHVLLKHAQTQGVLVLEGTHVREISFDGGRAVSALCVRREDEARSRIDFDYLIDASGRAGLLATRYLKNRRFHKVFRNIAIWGYWEGGQHQPGEREGVISVGSVRNGWLWAIPFSDGKMSIGAVVSRDAFDAARNGTSLGDVYERAIADSPLVRRITAGRRLVSELRVEQDYSYNATTFAGQNYFMAGDSACFLDPLLSTGVHLAMYSAMLSAAAIASLVREEITEDEALSYYEQSYRMAYVRLLAFVSAFYETEGKLGYFRKAEQLSQFDADPNNIKRAFLNLVSGLEDIAGAERTTAHLMGEMSRRIRENLELRQNKEALRRGEISEKARQSERFFDAIEGLPCLSPGGAVEGLYVGTRPRLGLKRVDRGGPVGAVLAGRRPPESLSSAGV